MRCSRLLKCFLVPVNASATPRSGAYTKTTLNFARNSSAVSALKRRPVATVPNTGSDVHAKYITRHNLAQMYDSRQLMLRRKVLHPRHLPQSRAQASPPGPTLCGRQRMAKASRAPPPPACLASRHPVSCSLLSKTSHGSRGQKSRNLRLHFAARSHRGSLHMDAPFMLSTAAAASSSSSNSTNPKPLFDSVHRVQAAFKRAPAQPRHHLPAPTHKHTHTHTHTHTHDGPRTLHVVLRDVDLNDVPKRNERSTKNRLAHIFIEPT